MINYQLHYSVVVCSYTALNEVRVLFPDRAAEQHKLKKSRVGLQVSSVVEKQ